MGTSGDYHDLSTWQRTADRFKRFPTPYQVVPMVRALKRLRSAGKSQGRQLFRPMTRFVDIAAMIESVIRQRFEP